MTDDRLAALERLAHAQADALVIAVAHLSALTFTNAALLAHLGDAIDRGVIREAALAALGTGPGTAQAVALVEALTAEPAAALVDRRAAPGSGDAPARLN